MTMDEIFNGKGDYYPGLIPLVHAYLDYINTDVETRKRLDEYLLFISKLVYSSLVNIATYSNLFLLGVPKVKPLRLLHGCVISSFHINVIKMIAY